MVKDEGHESSEASNDTINLRIITSESRINELEQKPMLLEKGIAKLEGSRIESIQKTEEWGFGRPSTQETEVMSIETIINHYISLICNEDKKITIVEVPIRLKI